MKAQLLAISVCFKVASQVHTRISLAVQWLKLLSFTAGGRDSIVSQSRTKIPAVAKSPQLSCTVEWALCSPLKTPLSSHTTSVSMCRIPPPRPAKEIYNLELYIFLGYSLLYFRVNIICNT